MATAEQGGAVSVQGSQSPPLAVILGPTAAGKSRFGVDLALRMGGEIISADSRQVYRGMDIGTGKLPPDEWGGVSHHLLDVVDPDEPFGLADYLERAREAIDAVRARGGVPLLVGGTGQYVWAIAEGWDVPRVAPDVELRAALEERARRLGADRLHAELAQLDPTAAAAIHPRNVRRVIRALEVAEATGARPSEFSRRRSPPPSIALIGLAPPRPQLYERIDRRVDAMFASGLTDEVETLLRRGYDRSLPSLSSIGYTQVVQFLHGELTRADAIARTKTATHRFARQQSTWFRAGDSRITWFSEFDLDAAMALVERSARRDANRELRGAVV